MESSVSTSRGSESEARKKRLKDFEALHDFIDMMKAAEEMNVDAFDDAVMEKHDESVCFLKTAIWDAQTKVMDEIARRRKANIRTKFVSLDKSENSYPKRGILKVSYVSDNPSVDESEVRSVDSEDNSTSSMQVVPANQSSALANNKILNSVRKVASNSMLSEPSRSLGSKSVAPKSMAANASKPTDSRLHFSPTKISTPIKNATPTKVTPPKSPDAPSTSKESKQQAQHHRIICSSANIFESLTQSVDLKPRNAASVDPRRSIQHNLVLQQQQQQHLTQLKRKGSVSAGPPRKIMEVKPLGLVPSYDIGTVVLAKYLKYSYWPALVVKRPEFPTESEESVYVMFWEGKETKMKTSFADVHYTFVKRWEDREFAEGLVPKNRRRKDWNDAVDLAEEMVLLTPEERFWKMILIEEKIGLETEYRPENGSDKMDPQKGDVVVVGKDTFYPGILTKDPLFFDNLRKDIYFVNGYLHVSFMEENTHGWYPIDELWILGKSRGERWPIPKGPTGQKFRQSMEVARNVLKMPREERFDQVGALASQ